MKGLSNIVWSDWHCMYPFFFQDFGEHVKPSSGRLIRTIERFLQPTEFIGNSLGFESWWYTHVVFFFQISVQEGIFTSSWYRSQSKFVAMDRSTWAVFNMATCAKVSWYSIPIYLSIPFLLLAVNAPISVMFDCENSLASNNSFPMWMFRDLPSVLFKSLCFTTLQLGFWRVSGMLDGTCTWSNLQQRLDMHEMKDQVRQSYS